MGGSRSLSGSVACLVRVSCKNTPERLYATGAGVWVKETQTVAILMLFNDRTVQLGFLGITTRVLSKLHVQIWPVCDSILSQLISHQGFPCIPCIFGVCSCLSEYLVPLWSVLMCFRMMVAGCGVHFYNSNSAQW